MCEGHMGLICCRTNTNLINNKMTDKLIVMCMYIIYMYIYNIRTHTHTHTKKSIKQSSQQLWVKYLFEQMTF